MASVQKIKLSPSRDIPFNKLVLSQSNVRRVKAGVSIEQLAESIAQRTLLQSLSVRAVVDADGQETGMFEVPAGGRRYRALELLVKQKRMAKTQPVPCVVRDAASPRTIPSPRTTSGSAYIRSISSARSSCCVTVA
jgi:ParB family chromosome partitioning protein